MQHPDWPIKIVAAKYNAVETAWKIADLALKCPAGSGCSRRARWSACSATPAPAASIPANSALTHELIGKLALGINPDDPQSWG